MIFKSRRKLSGFTLLETVLVLAIMGVLALMVSSKIGLYQKDSLGELDRFLAKARALALDQGPFAVISEKGEIAVLSGGGRKVQSLKSPDGTWTLDPEKMIIYKDGTITPGKASLKNKKGKESFLISVTARAYEAP